MSGYDKLGEPGAPAEGPGGKAKEAEGKSALVIEDDERTRPALVDVLETMGYRVHSASTGTAGAEILEALNGNVDVILCDMHLPDGDGHDLAQLFGRRWRQPRFLLISGESKTGSEGGFDDRYRWLSKPFTVADLRAAIRALTG